jgi:hypothetical protein
VAENMPRPPYRDTTGAYLAGDGTWVELRGPVTPAAVQSAAADLAARPAARLTVRSAGDTDLGFLANLPPLTDLQVYGSRVSDIGALARHAGSLRSVQLDLGRRPVDVTVLGALPGLRQLYLHKNGPAAVHGAPAAVAAARRLEHLVLHSVTIPSVEPLTGLPELTGLALKLGGAPDLAAFGALRSLRFFEAWQVRGLTDLTPVAASRTLEVLYLESLRRAELPDFSGAVSLQHVVLDNLPLTGAGLAGLAAAPALRQLTIVRPAVDPADVDVLRGHPTLQAAWLGLRGRGITEADERLGLDKPHDAPLVAFGAGVMGLPPDGWCGRYLEEGEAEDPQDRG